MLDLPRLRAMVAEAKVCVGLRSQVLQEATQVSDSDRDLVIAVGDPPRSPWFWRLRPECQGNLRSVEPGQVIADQVCDEARSCADGLSVDGKVLPSKRDEICDVILGAGLARQGNELQATAEGLLKAGQGVLWEIVEDPRGKAKRDAILFTSDDMHSAWVRLEPGSFIPMEIIQRLLAEKGVVYGLIPDAINIIAKGVQTAQTIELARGIYAQDGENGAIEFLIDDRINYEVREDGTFDFRAANPICEVQRDQVLARFTAPGQGTPGMTIRGQRLEPKAGKPCDPNRFCGEGVRIVNIGDDGAGELHSEKNGVYNKLVTGKIQVKEQVIIDGDVDMKSGNVETEYPIRITGDIKSGFIVKSNCDIVVDGSIEDARVSAQGNLQVKGGILPGQNRVKAHGDIQARFIEGRHIKARSLLVSSSIRHCTVYSTGEVVAQEIIGGQVVAAENIVIKQAGDEMEQRTVLQAGVDPMQQSQFDEAIESKQRLEPELARKKDALKAAVNNANQLAKKATQLTSQSVSPKHLKKVAQEGREALERSRALRQELEALQARLAAIEVDIGNYENASSRSAKCTVQVGSAYYPGVEVRIGRHARKRMVGGGGACIFRIEGGVIVH